MEEEFINPATLTIERLQPKRPKVGNDASVLLWRLVRLVGLNTILKEETEMISYLMGKQIGKMIKATDVADLKKKLEDMKVGIIEIGEQTDSGVNIAFGECLTCAGINPPLGKPICQLEAGLVVGVLENIYPERKISGVETKCMGGLGDDVCLIECSWINMEK